MKKSWWLVFCLGLTGCSWDWLFFWEDDEPEPTEETTAAAPPAAQSSQKAEAEPMSEKSVELRLSKLWNRVDQLEAQLRRQKEDFHLLRKGLMTGLIPSEWQDDLPKYSASYVDGTPPLNQRNQGDVLETMLGGEGESGRGHGKDGLSDAERSRYERTLAKASNYFRAGDYGKAILVYSEIGRDYSDRVTGGSHLLWIGASWYRLKDYQAARKNLTKLIRLYKASPWVAEAQFLLAKTDFQEGFVERSIQNFKDIIARYPKDSVADRSKEELRRIEENL